MADNPCPHCATPASTDAAFCLRCGMPRRLGKYPIKDVIGRGGMGTVYLGHHPDLDIPVAIKVMNREGVEDRGLTERFRREARTVARLHHPGIVQVHDVGSEGDLIFLVMEWIEGEQLSTVLARGPLTEARAAKIAMTLAEALAHAHHQGVYHRDLKPGNVMIDKEGHPRLLDFGLAKMSDAGVALTRASEVVGTPAYLPPETLAESAPTPNPAMDIYGLGATLYESLTCRQPYDGPSAISILRAIESHPPAPVESLNPAVSPAMAAVVKRAMARKPEDRFGSMDDFAAALGPLAGVPTAAAAAAPPPPPPRRSVAKWIAAFSTAMALVAWGIVLWPRGRAGPDRPPRHGHATPLPDPTFDDVMAPDAGRPDRLREYLRSHENSGHPDSLARCATACLFLGRYRFAAEMADAAGEPDLAALARLYGESLPLLLPYEAALSLGESGEGVGAQPTVPNLAANLRARRFEVAQEILSTLEGRIAGRDVHAARAAMALASGDLDAAEDPIRDGLTAEPDYPPLLWMHAAVATIRGRVQTAEARRNDWLAVVEPGTPDAAEASAVLDILGGSWSQAGAEVERLSGWEEDEPLRLIAAMSRYEVRRTEHVHQPPSPRWLNEMRRLAASDRFVGAMLLQAKIENAAGRPEEARARYAEVTRRLPGWASDAKLSEYATLLANATPDSPAMDPLLDLERVPFTAPADAEILLGRVVDYAATAGDVELERAARLARAALLLPLGRFPEARPDLDRLLELGLTAAQIAQSPKFAIASQDPDFRQWLEENP